MPGLKDRRPLSDLIALGEVAISFVDYLRARRCQRTPVDTEPRSLNLSAHSIFWSMPTDSALYDAFHPFLAENIISSTWRKTHKTCFCDLALHHIQQLMTPIDIAKDCPKEGNSFMERLETVFAEPILKAIDDEMTAIARITSVRETNA